MTSSHTRRYTGCISNKEPAIDIWVSKCRRTAKCNHCGQDIKLGEPVVRGRLWRQYEDRQSEAKKWVRNFRWHARRSTDGLCCWIEQALVHLGTQKYVEKRGRKPLVLSPEVRKARLRLLQRRARVMQQLRLEAEKAPEVRDIERIITLGGQLTDLQIEIQPIGGVPKSWT